MTATTERTHGGQGQNVAMHTPGPWYVGDNSAEGYAGEHSRWVVNSDDWTVAAVITDVPELSERGAANAARIVECVNACEGFVHPGALREQFDDTLAALRSRVADLEAALQALLIAADKSTCDSLVADSARIVLLSTTKGADK